MTPKVKGQGQKIFFVELSSPIDTSLLSRLYDLPFLSYGRFIAFFMAFSIYKCTGVFFVVFQPEKFFVELGSLIETSLLSRLYVFPFSSYGRFSAFLWPFLYINALQTVCMCI